MENKVETTSKRIKRESNGFNILDPEFVKKSKRRDIAINMRIVKKLGRKISDKEWLSMPF